MKDVKMLTRNLSKNMERLWIKLSRWPSWFVFQSDILLSSVDVFENFHNKCIEIYKLEPNHFLLVQ